MTTKDEELEWLRAEVKRLTPPAWERYVRCSTQLVDELGKPSRPVRLTVTEREDGFYYLIATSCACPLDQFNCPPVEG